MTEAEINELVVKAQNGKTFQYNEATYSQGRDGWLQYHQIGRAGQIAKKDFINRVKKREKEYSLDEQKSTREKLIKAIHHKLSFFLGDGLFYTWNNGADKYSEIKHMTANSVATRDKIISQKDLVVELGMVDGNKLCQLLSIDDRDGVLDKPIDKPSTQIKKKEKDLEI